MKSLRQSISGFTIVEMMVVMTVIGILAMYAVSNFTSLNQSQQAKNASFELFTSLGLARSEAIKRNANVTLTPTDASNWGKGWTITTITPVTLAIDTIKSQEALKGVNVTLGPASVVYARTGRMAAATAPAFQLDVSPVNTNVRRCIRIDLSGMPRSAKGACA